jgi:putative endonuclease
VFAGGEIPDAHQIPASSGLTGGPHQSLIDVMSKRYPCIAVYMMASRKNGPIYIGVTNDLVRRVHEHQEQLRTGFTSKYNCKSLVWYEIHDLMSAAIQRERRLKHLLRYWKIELIERRNPDWRDLSETLWHN